MAGRGFAAVAALLVGVAGCYSPHVDSCLYACNAGRCPDGLACNGQQMCAETAATLCGDAIDAAPDMFLPDTTAPETMLTQMPPSTDSATDVTFAFTSNEAGHFECQEEDTGQFVTCTSPHVMTVSTPGPHAFSVRAIDEAGNIDMSPARWSWTVDFGLPNTMITAMPAALTNAQDATFMFASTGGGPGVHYECGLDGALLTACTSPKMYASLGEGQHVFEVRALTAMDDPDPSPATHMWTVDRSPPDTSFTQKPSNPAITDTATFVISSTEAGSTFTCSLDAAAFTACNATTMLTALTDGMHTFQAIATDGAGNPDGTAVSYTWKVDSHAPVITVTSPTNGGSTGPLVTFTWTTNESTTDTCKIDNVDVACSSPFSQRLPHGMHTFAVKAVDGVGLMSTTTVTWMVDCAYSSGPGGTGIAMFHFDDSGQAIASSTALPNAPAYLGTDATTEAVDAVRVMPGRLGVNAIQFSGTQRVTWNAMAQPQIVHDFTLAFWIRPVDGTSTATNDLISSKDEKVLIYQAPSAGPVLIAAQVKDGVSAVTLVTTTPLTTAVWHEVVVTYSAAAQTTLMFIDGAQVATGPIVTNPSYDFSTMRFGADTHNAAGLLDEVLISGTAITATQVSDRFCPL